MRRARGCCCLLVVLACTALVRAAPTGHADAVLEANLFASVQRRMHAHHVAAGAKRKAAHAHKPGHTKAVLARVASTTTNATHQGNASHPQWPVAGTPLPLDIYWAGHEAIVREGRCLHFCRPSRSNSALSALRWASHSHLPLPISLSLSTDTRQVVSNVRAVALGGDAAVTRVVVPVANHSADGDTGTPQGVSIHHDCRSRGQTYIHIVVSSPVPGYNPIHLYSHVACAAEQVGCEGVPCGEHGTCVNGTCSCHLGFSGPTCSVSEFSDCPNGCHGNAVACTASNHSAVCVCKPGFSGVDCGIASGCVALDRCSGHGQCLDSLACGCDEGWTGPTCAHATEGDSLCGGQHYCKGHGRCVREGVDYVCDCEPGFTGSDCGSVVPSCPAACSGHGVCVNGECQCNFGFRGESCAEVFSPCGGCAHGVCSEAVGSASATCVCEPGYAGAHCAVYTPATDPCNHANFCSGHGECPAERESACQCDAGFGGDDCSLVVEQGCERFCAGHGECDAVTDTCKCEDAWSGPGCAVSLCPVADGAVCSGFGACVNGASSMVCNCANGFFGVDCRSAECKANVTCSGHGKCRKSSGVLSSLCECEEGWEGVQCGEPSSTPEVALVNALHPNDDNEASEDLDQFPHPNA